VHGGHSPIGSVPASASGGGGAPPSEAERRATAELNGASPEAAPDAALRVGPKGPFSGGPSTAHLPRKGNGSWQRCRVVVSGRAPTSAQGFGALAEVLRGGLSRALHREIRTRCRVKLDACIKETGPERRRDGFRLAGQMGSQPPEPRSGGRQRRVRRPPRRPFPPPLVAPGCRAGMNCGPVRGEPCQYAGPEFGTQRSRGSPKAATSWVRSLPK
jgi:hypothetical protein